MSIRRLASDVTSLTFSPLEKSENENKAFRNTLRMSIWCALGTGSIAVISAIFCRYVIHPRSWVAPYVLNSSLAHCGGFTTVGAYLLYKMLPIDRPDSEWEKVNREAGLFERNLTYLTGSLFAAFLLRTALKEDPPLSTLAKAAFSNPLFDLFDAVTFLYTYHYWETIDAMIAQQNKLEKK